MGWEIFLKSENRSEPLEVWEARERAKQAQAELEWREAAEVRPPPEVAA
jgi:hypothetical protein